MITLRIFLMGLVALVPQEVRGRRTMTVLLQDAQHGSHKHIPVLIYEEKRRVCEPMPNCQIGDGNKIARLLNRGERSSPGLLLKGVDIEVQNADTGGMRLLENAYKKRFYHSWLGVVPRTAQAGNDFGWVPRMEDVVPGSHKVRCDVLTAPAGKLAGKLLLQGGHLSSFGLVDVRGFVRSLTFKKPGSVGPLRGEKHALGDTAVVDLKVCGDEVVIKLKPFADGEPQTLTLKPDHGLDTVEILLGNLTPLVKKVDRSKPAEHFALYTELSANPKTPQEIKIPHLGWRRMKIRRTAIEVATPEVIRSVSAVGSAPAVSRVRAVPGMAGISGGEGGTNRPICTLAVMAPPD